MIKRSKVGLIKLETMEEKNENRSKWLNIRLKPDEYKGLESRFNKTAFQTMRSFLKNTKLISLLLFKKLTEAS